jgi:hypothetical protein
LCESDTPQENVDEAKKDVDEAKKDVDEAKKDVDEATPKDVEGEVPVWSSFGKCKRPQD